MNFLKFIQRIPEFLYRYKFKKTFKLKYYPCVYKKVIIVGNKQIKIGAAFAAFPGVRLEVYGADYSINKDSEKRIIIGDNVCLNYRTHIGAINKVVLGNGVLTGSDVLITDHNHGKYDDNSDLLIRPAKRLLYSKGPTIIGNNVWIGDKACVLPGVTIGDNTIIGAGSVVTHDIPSNCVACGNPAKVVKYLQKE